MGVVTVNSASIANRNARPKVLNNPYVTGARPVVGCELVVCGAADSAGSVYRFFPIPSSAVLRALKVANDANTSGTSYKFGVALSSDNAAAGGLPVANADVIFASGITMATARTTKADILSPSILNAGYVSTNWDLRIWELLGLTVDPFVEYDLIMGVVTPGSAGGNVIIEAGWVQ